MKKKVSRTLQNGSLIIKDVFLEINNDNDGIQFIMFPHLGGNGFSLMNLAKEFAQQGLNVWVAYPPDHLGSKGGLCNSYNELMDFYLKNIKNILKKNSIFFGHSMGGVIAYLLAKQIEEDLPEKKPKALILSATPEPEFMKGKEMSSSSDNELIDNLNKIGGMPEEIEENKELMDIFIPIFRSDYKVLEDISMQANMLKQKPLSIPTEFIFCKNDEMTQYKNIMKWNKYIISKSYFLNMPDEAGYMYLNKYSNVVVKYVMQFLNFTNKEQGRNVIK